MKMCIRAGSHAKHADIHLPVSKSVLNRQLALSYLAGELSALPEEALPRDVLIFYDLLVNKGEVRNVMDAGTAMRFATAVLASTPGKFRLTGTDRMLQRPVGPLVESLNKLGADITYAGVKGYPPLKMEGRQLLGGRIEIDAGISSQFISALLMVAPMAKEPVELHWKGRVVSRPYIDLTLRQMEGYGARYERSENSIKVWPSVYRPMSLESERDWSSAAFFYSCCALNPGMELILKGLKENDLQGDKSVMTLYELLGVQSTFISGGLSITGHGTGSVLTPLEVDFTDIPDLVQPFVMTCAALRIDAHVTGLYNLHLKETNRLTALEWNVGQLGGNFRHEGHKAWLKTGEIIKRKREFKVFGDHRMAMSLAPLAGVVGTVELNEAESVEKSFPGYWHQLVAAGYSVKEIR